MCTKILSSDILALQKQVIAISAVHNHNYTFSFRLTSPLVFIDYPSHANSDIGVVIDETTSIAVLISCFRQIGHWLVHSLVEIMKCLLTAISICLRIGN